MTRIFRRLLWSGFLGGLAWTTALAGTDFTGEWKANIVCDGVTYDEHMWLEHTGKHLIGTTVKGTPCHPNDGLAVYAYTSLAPSMPARAWIMTGNKNDPNHSPWFQDWSSPDSNHLKIGTTTWTRVSGPIARGGQALGVSGVSVACKNLNTGGTSTGKLYPGQRFACDTLPVASGEGVTMTIKARE